MSRDLLQLRLFQFLLLEFLLLEFLLLFSKSWRLWSTLVKETLHWLWANHDSNNVPKTPTTPSRAATPTPNGAVARYWVTASMNATLVASRRCRLLPMCWIRNSILTKVEGIDRSLYLGQCFSTFLRLRNPKWPQKNWRNPNCPKKIFAEPHPNFSKLTNSTQPYLT